MAPDGRHLSWAVRPSAVSHRLAPWRQATLPQEAVQLGRWNGRLSLSLSLKQLVHCVDHRCVEVALIAPEYSKRLIAIAEKGPQGPRELNPHEREQHRPRTHDRKSLSRIDLAFFADQAQSVVQRVHAEQTGDPGDADIQEMLEVVVRSCDQEERGDRHERGKQN